MNGNFSRLPVSNLSDHDDVWVLSNNRPQCAGKSEFDLWFDLNLINAIDLVFDRILDCDNFVLGRFTMPSAA